MAVITVLVADSSSAGHDAARAALAGRGCRVLAAGTSAEADRTLAGEEVHVLVLGPVLDGAEGWQGCARLRASHQAVPLQIVLLLPAGAPGDAARALEAGADDFVRLPGDPDELAARVKAAAARREAQAGLIKEREFYRIAVAEEERLSRLVLDQNQSLKAAYEKIRQLNAELEKANHELEQLAAYDALSGLLNRRTLFSRIAVEIERSARMKVPLTGLMIDIDRFKGINDNYGHPCGDLVIREIGARLQNRLRKYDFAGRYGGEEFFVLLSNSTESQAERIGDRFRREMAETRFTCNGESFAVTLSIGVAKFLDSDTQESWIERTDRALYRAKEAGRNRVVIA